MVPDPTARIGRRTVLFAATVVALPVPAGDALAFRLMRRGSDIGRHTVNFERQGEVTTVRVSVDALVTLLSIPIVRYAHRASETRRGGMLVSLTGETNKNGRHEWVSARRTGEGLVVLGSKTERYIAPEPAFCTSYWDRRQLDGPMISLEDGVLLRPKVSVHQAETIKVASGDRIVADHYNLSGAFKVDLWYDDAGTWASLGYTAADGSSVTYERL